MGNALLVFLKEGKMKAKNRVIMAILKDAFGDTIPVGAFMAVTEAYKAGHKECAKTHFKPDWKIKAQDIYDATEEGKRAGIREVVEWIKSRSQVEHCDPDVMQYFNEYRWIDEEEWEIKLKDWSIKEVKDGSRVVS